MELGISKKEKDLILFQKINWNRNHGDAKLVILLKQKKRFFIVIIFTFNALRFEEKTLSLHLADVREGKSVCEFERH